MQLFMGLLSQIILRFANIYASTIYRRYVSRIEHYFNDF